jgi:hypothetical protein
VRWRRRGRCRPRLRPGARHFATTAELVAALGERPVFASVLVKGSRFMKMEQVVAALQTIAAGRTPMLLSLAQWLQGCTPNIRLPARLPVPDLPRRDGGHDRAGHRPGLRPLADPPPDRAEDRPAHPRVRVQTHLAKAGTPTMGGVLILIGIGVATLLWSDWSNRFVWIVMMVTFGFGAIGWADDWRKVVDKNPEGMRSREKFFWQSLIGVVAALYLAFSVSETTNVRVIELFVRWVQSGFSNELPPKADLMLPFFKSISYPLGVFGFMALTYFVIVGASNAVNLTDGLDGLAIMPVVLVSGALGIFAYVVGNAVYAKYLLFPTSPARAS